MTEDAIVTWERQFRADAEADDYELLRHHLRRLELPDQPELLLEGTIKVVEGWSCYWAVDGREEPFDRFLEMQAYNPLDAINAPYAFTFNISGKAFGRILSPADLRRLDLADLYNHPWNDYERAGYNQLFISRTDWAQLTNDEVEMLEREVTGDLRFDYTDDEVQFWFEEPSSGVCLIVNLHEGPEPD